MLGGTATQAAAEDELKRNDEELYRNWRNLTGIEALGWRRAAEGQPFGPLDLAYAQSEFAAHMEAHPEPDDAAVRSLARYYLQQRAITVIEAPSLAALYRNVLQRGLHWIDLDALRMKQGARPTQILRTVCQYRRLSLDHAALDRRLANRRDVIADEAALIYFHTRPDRQSPTPDASMQAVRAQFATALIDEWQDAGIGIALLPSAPVAPVHARFWYDGFSLQNARGKRLQDIAAEIFDTPFEAEPPNMQRLIAQASHFGHLPGYPCNGTIDAALRETLIRTMHGNLAAISRHEPRPGAACLAGVYLTRTESDAIVAARMRDLMLGTHYPKCSVLDAVETCVRRLAPLHDIDFDAYDHPARLIKAYNALNRAWSSDPRFAVSPSPYAGRYLTRCRNVELAHANSTDLQRRLHDYVEEELLALSPLPVFDEDFQIEQILRRKLKMNDRDIRLPRSARFTAPDFPAPPKTLWIGVMTPAEEFKTRKSIPGSIMKHGAASIDPKRELEYVQRQAAAQLSTHPVIRAKVEEAMRRHDVPRDADHADNTQRLRQTLANSVAGLPAPSSLDAFLRELDLLFGSPTVAAIVKAVASGEPRRMLELLPFVVPLYDIEEGIRHRDWELAKTGALHLGEDLVFTAIGLGAEKILMRQLALDVKSVLAARAGSAGGEAIEMVRRQPVSIEADAEELSRPGEDAAPIETPEHTRPKMPGAELFPDRRVHLTIDLIDENKSIPVKPIGDAFAETDRRGNVLPHAPIVFGDIASGRGYRMLRRPAQLPMALPIPAQELSTRQTVIDVLARHRRLSRLPNIAARRPDPGRIVQALFSYVHEAETDALRQLWRRAYARYSNYAQFEAFWTDLYRRSDTAVHFLNAAYDSLASRGSTEVSFDAAHARVIGNEVCLLGDKDLANLHYVSLSGATRFQRARMLIHEVLHALAKTSDPEPSAAFAHRGETTFFTGLILDESGASTPAPTRIAYAMPPVFSDGEAAHRLWSRHLLDLHDITAAEDLLLDRVLAANRVPAPSAIILGQKIGERLTVRQGLALAKQMRISRKFGPRNIDHLFELTASNFDLKSSPDLRELLKSLISESKTLRELAHAWLNKFSYFRIKLKHIDFLLGENGSGLSAISHTISDNTIWLNTEKLYYFSERGLAPLSEKRLFAGSMVDFFIGELLPSMPRFPMHQRLDSRGVQVLLENEILAQAGDPSPPRICAELAVDSTSYLMHLTAIRRAADAENAYLRQAVRDSAPPVQGAAIGDDLLGLTEEELPHA
ncbi:hypothetical protein D9O50_18230 [Oxalobacteraceae bacterium CAVE-383]|nr:hypothetical protein D9O50_18230 [Oxalobacteraceae bacterium CAVE-383]